MMTIPTPEMQKELDRLYSEERLKTQVIHDFKMETTFYTDIDKSRKGTPLKDLLGIWLDSVEKQPAITLTMLDKETLEISTVNFSIQITSVIGNSEIPPSVSTILFKAQMKKGYENIEPLFHLYNSLSTFLNKTYNDVDRTLNYPYVTAALFVEYNFSPNNSDHRSSFVFRLKQWEKVTLKTIFDLRFKELFADIMEYISKENR